MIIDYLKNKNLYLDEKLQKILDFIQQTKFSKITENKIFIDDYSFFIISDIFTKPQEEGFWESHKKYIDIHYVLEGSELIGYENITNLEVNKPYNEEKDLITYHGNIKNAIELTQGMFLVAYPEDAHMSNISTKLEISPLKKIIFKIKY